MTEYRPLVLMVEDNKDVLRLNAKWLMGAGFDTVGAGGFGNPFPGYRGA
jgi:hypothetical protein